MLIDKCDSLSNFLGRRIERQILILYKCMTLTLSKCNDLLPMHSLYLATLIQKRFQHMYFRASSRSSEKPCIIERICVQFVTLGVRFSLKKCSEHCIEYHRFKRFFRRLAFSSAKTLCLGLVSNLDNLTSRK